MKILHNLEIKSFALFKLDRIGNFYRNQPKPHLSKLHAQVDYRKLNLVLINLGRRKS